MGRQLCSNAVYDDDDDDDDCMLFEKFRMIGLHSTVNNAQYPPE